MIKAKAAGLNVNCVRKRIKAGLTEEEALSSKARSKRCFGIDTIGVKTFDTKLAHKWAMVKI